MNGTTANPEGVQAFGEMMMRGHTPELDMSKDAVEEMARMLDAEERRLCGAESAEAQMLRAQSARIAELEAARDGAFKAGQFDATDAISKQVWNDGVPDKTYGSEWFIAKLTEGGRKVVLRALYDEHSYDYTTADETYVMASRVAKWMQFPDSNFIPYVAPSNPTPEDKGNAG